MLSKVLFEEKAKATAALRAKIVKAGKSKWVKNHPIFVLNYLTSLEHTKTIIHLSFGG